MNYTGCLIEFKIVGDRGPRKDATLSCAHLAAGALMFVKGQVCSDEASRGKSWPQQTESGNHKIGVNRISKSYLQCTYSKEHM